MHRFDVDAIRAVPARFSNTRVTDESGQVQVLAPDDPLFHYPNEIGDAAWRNWVQEQSIFVGLGLWRQVGAGSDGAFQLPANLASRGKLPGK